MYNFEKLERSKRDKRRWYGAAFLILTALLLVFLVLNICIGSVNIPLREVASVLGQARGRRWDWTASRARPGEQARRGRRRRPRIS